MKSGGGVGWSGWVSQTSPIPRSPDGDKKCIAICLFECSSIEDKSFAISGREKEETKGHRVPPQGVVGKERGKEIF